MKSILANNRRSTTALWAIWTAVFVCAVGLFFVFPASSSGYQGGLAFAFAELPYIAIVVAAVIRWLAIPRATQTSGVLALSILGIALSEAAIYAQVFLVGELYAQARMIVFTLGLLSLTQFIPSFLARHLNKPAYV